jgi:hypothetical protein
LKIRGSFCPRHQREKAPEVVERARALAHAGDGGEPGCRRQARDADERGPDGLQLEKVHGDERADRQRDQEKGKGAQDPRTLMQPPLPGQIGGRYAEEHRDDQIGRAVRVERHGEAGQRQRQEARPLHRGEQQPHTERERRREQVRLQRPAAHHDVPGADRQEERREQRGGLVGGLAGEGVEHEEREQSGDQAHGTQRADVQAEHGDDRHRQVRVQRVLATAPRDQVDGIAVAVAIDAVMQERPRLVAGRGLVLVEPGRDEAERVDAHDAGHDQDRQEQQERAAHVRAPRPRRPLSAR